LEPTYQALAPASKVHFIQSLVSRLLVEQIFDAYFIGLSKDHAEELSNVEKHLSSYGKILLYIACYVTEPSSGSLESMNQWRSTTLAILDKVAIEKLQAETTAIVEAVVKQVNNIMESISDIQHSESRDQSLRALINSSIELSRLLRIQKAVFSTIMPSIEGHQRTIFDPELMEDIGGEDEDTLNEREIRCVTFPGIVKTGDENGERNHLRNIVAKIRVLCAPD
jgi:activating signal cointegrator complex subunit 1